jgi:hypothetical protein
VIIGALVVVLCIGSGIGLLGRFVVPGRHGLVRVLFRDTRLASRLLRHDDEVWWEVGAGVLGALAGYVAGRLYDGYSLLGATPLRWYLAVVGSLVLVGIAILSGVIERSRWTRRLGMHEWLSRGAR